MNRARALVALVSGVTFGFGLSLSGMLDPERVRGFLDVFGSWDPSLLFVLGGAVLVARGGVAIMHRLHRPALDSKFHVPIATRIDGRLILGSAIFGVGWGMAESCPGLTVTALSLGLPTVTAFVLAMLVAMLVHDRFGAPRIVARTLEVSL